MKITCGCGKCKKCRRRVYMRNWRAGAARRTFLRDLDLFLPAGYTSTLNPKGRYAICLR